MSNNNFWVRHSFFIMTFIAIPSVLALDWFDIVDAALMIYGICALAAFTCGSMFADWWRIKGAASSVYKWITVLLFSVSLYFSIDFTARYIYVYFHDQYEVMLTCALWRYRAVPIQLSLLYLLYFAIKQRWGKHEIYHYGIKKDIVEGFDRLEARIMDGELKFEGHAHEGLVFGAKLILKPIANDKE